MAIVETKNTRDSSYLDMSGVENNTISWDLLQRAAKMISKNEGTGDKQVNSNTAEITFTLGKTATYTIGVGDVFKLNGKKVIILGFNHDELVDKTVYGGNNTHAGISFNYLDSIDDEQHSMKDTDTTEGGWADTNIRRELNGTDSSAEGSWYETLKQYVDIKKVKKQYIKVYNDATSNNNYTEDYLWLPSLNEISSFKSGDTSWYIANEGNIYKFISLIRSLQGGTDSVGIWLTYAWTRTPSNLSNSKGKQWIGVFGRSPNTYNATGEAYIVPGFAI